MKLGWLVGAGLALLSCASAAAELRIVDSDTFVLDGETIRLWGINGPEDGQECQRKGRPWYPAPEATAALREILARSEGLACTKREVDRQGRTVATCRANGRDIGHEMVQGGWAWDFFEYSSGFYIAIEAEARTHERGIWSAQCTVPWRWRRTTR